MATQVPTEYWIIPSKISSFVHKRFGSNPKVYVDKLEEFIKDDLYDLNNDLFRNLHKIKFTKKRILNAININKHYGVVVKNGSADLLDLFCLFTFRRKDMNWKGTLKKFKISPKKIHKRIGDRMSDDVYETLEKNGFLISVEQEIKNDKLELSLSDQHPISNEDIDILNTEKLLDDEESSKNESYEEYFEKYKIEHKIPSCDFSRSTNSDFTISVHGTIYSDERFEFTEDIIFEIANLAEFDRSFNYYVKLTYITHKGDEEVIIDYNNETNDSKLTQNVGALATIEIVFNYEKIFSKMDEKKHQDKCFVELYLTDSMEFHANSPRVVHYPFFWDDVNDDFIDFAADNGVYYERSKRGGIARD